MFSGETSRALPIGKNSGIYATLIPAATQGNLANQDVGGTKGESTQNFAVHGGRADRNVPVSRRSYFGEHIGNAANFAASVNPRHRTGSQRPDDGRPDGRRADRRRDHQRDQPRRRQPIPRHAEPRLRPRRSPGRQHQRRSEVARRHADGHAASSCTTSGFGFGGPLKRDRVWFFASARKWESSSYRAGNYYNKSANPLFYEAGPVAPRVRPQPERRSSASASPGRRRRSTRSAARALRVQLQLQLQYRDGAVFARGGREQLVPAVDVEPGVLDLSRRPTGCCSRSAA